MPINNITQTISTIPPAGARGVDVQTQFVIKQEDFQDHLQGTTVTELNTLKDQLNSRIGEINSTTTTMNGYASTASAGASTATTKAGEASSSASDALAYKNQAETFKNNASASATKASQWADNNYNVEVETGKYSAKHWSTVAQNATANKVDKVTSTDNAVVRFNGTTGEVQNSSVVIDDSGNVGIGTNGYTGYGKLGLIGQIGITCSGMDAVSARGLQFFIDGNKHGNLSVDNYDNLLYIGNGIGYGTGAGGTVTQLTSKSTTVTLNKPTGVINTHSSSIAGNSRVQFIVYNNLLVDSYFTVDCVLLGYSVDTSRYECNVMHIQTGSFVITLENKSASAYSDTLQIQFNIKKGAFA